MSIMRKAQTGGEETTDQTKTRSCGNLIWADGGTGCDEMRHVLTGPHRGVVEAWLVGGASTRKRSVGGVRLVYAGGRRSSICCRSWEPTVVID